LNAQHIGQSPLPAYEPAFDWENERALIFGQRIPETPISQYGICEMFLSRVYFNRLLLLFLAQLSFSLSFLFCSASQWNEDICKSSVFTISSRIGWWVLCCWYWWYNVIDILLHLFVQLPMLCHLVLVFMLRVGSSVWHSALFLFSWSVEPFYGTICLYNRERREKLSEDFYFNVLPTEMQDVSYAS